MTVLLAVFAASLAEIGLQSMLLWPILAAGRPLVLVVVAVSRRWQPIHVAWFGLALGLLSDLIALRAIGPGGIAGVLAGILVATVTTRFELEGPLFWVVGGLLGAGASEVGEGLVLTSLGQATDHGLIGGLAAVAMTAALAMLVAAAERGWQTWTSPERRRRRALRRR